MAQHTIVYAEPSRFENGWFCTVCACVTEHKEVEGQQVCLACGFKMGQQQKAYYKANRAKLSVQKKAYYKANRAKLRISQRDANRRYQQRKHEKLQRVLDATQMEVC